MSNKNVLFLLISIMALAGLVILLKDLTLSTKAEPYNPENADSLIRVGISTNNFGALEYDKVSVTSEGKFALADKSNNAIIVESDGNEVFTVRITDTTLSVYNCDELIAENITGPIGVKSLDNSPIEISGLKRAGKLAKYRGEIEIVKSPTRNNKFSVVNILPLEEYLKGVVPNEMPVRFGAEALKAQTVAARNYAVKPRVKTYPQFDICDSVECQVYFGYNTESPVANQAIEDTKGLVALYNDELILALYSSTAGGYTENYENAFSDSGSNAFPGKTIPYLKGKPDFEDFPRLDNEDAAKAFYTSAPDSFEADSSYFRWKKNWTREELENILNKNLAKYAQSPFLDPGFDKNTGIGTLNKVEIISRGVSGKAMVAKISSSNGEWHVFKELVIRRIFENSGKILPSANVIFNNVYDSDGNLVSVEAVGGGLGHGVGMSQFGAGYMSKKGYTFDKILQHYYDGISIGTTPVLLGTEPVRQVFSALNGRADLIVKNTADLDNVKISINGTVINITKDQLNSNKSGIVLDKYITKGLNEIVYYPAEKGKNVKVRVEVYPAVQTNGT